MGSSVKSIYRALTSMIKQIRKKNLFILYIRNAISESSLSERSCSMEAPRAYNSFSFDASPSNTFDFETLRTRTRSHLVLLVVLKNEGVGRLRNLPASAQPFLLHLILIYIGGFFPISVD